jgi:F-type H+-transporting ATPase subunit c
MESVTNLLKIFALLLVTVCVVAPVCVQAADTGAGATTGEEPVVEDATHDDDAGGGEPAYNLAFGWAFGIGLVILGAAFGIGKIGAAAVESMARQPEVAGNIQTAMIISAALIEGATFFALIVCIMKT